MDGISPNFIFVIYIGKILDSILPVGFHKFVTELWALIDILKHEMHYSEAIVRFSELISQRRIGRFCSNLMCIVKRWRIVEHYLRTALSTN